MNVRDAILKSRSYRRFYEEVDVSVSDLRMIVDAARLSPSGMNIQPLKYFISNDRSLNERIFGTLGWAGYLKEWDGPQMGERPSAYIVQLLDEKIASGYLCDDGITAQSMMLQAVELGFGGCIIASVKRERLSEILSLPPGLRIVMVIAIGKPKEKVVIEEMKDNMHKYHRDENGVHYVPKRSLDEVIIKHK